MVLSFELWWARRKLAAKGGMLAKVTWQLLVNTSPHECLSLIRALADLFLQLVTFHGGVAVTALQLTALFLFEYKRAAAYCYLPILFVSALHLPNRDTRTTLTRWERHQRFTLLHYSSP